MREVEVTNETRGSLLGKHVRVADTSLTRLFGLLGKSDLNAGEGLWIRPSSGVHTFFMRFTIDVIGLDRELKVVKLWPQLAPWRATSICTRIQTVIELPPGHIAATSTELGDVLRFR